MAKAGAIRAGRAFIELFTENSKLVRGLRAAEGEIRAFGNYLNSVGRQMTMLGIAAAAPFALSVRTFASFDDQMRLVKAVTGSTGEEFDMLTEKAKFLGRTTSYTASQVAGAMVELGRAGFQPKEIDDATGAMLDLARATGTDLSVATEIAGNTLRRFNLDADEMTRVADTMTATANTSALTLVDLGESLKDAGPLASTYGMTLEELCKTLGSLANFGIKGSVAGTTMKNIFTRLADPSIQKSFHELGVEITELDANGRKKMRNVADVLRDVGKAVEGFDPDVRLAKFNELFGLRAIAGGAKLTGAQFDNLNQAIDNAGGAARRTAVEMDAGLGGSFRMMWSAVEGVAIAIGEALAPTLQKLTDWLTAVTSGLVEYIAKNQEWIVKTAKVIAVVLGVGAGLMTLSFGLIGVANGIGFVAGVIANVAKIALMGFSLIAWAISGVTSVAGLLVSAFSGIATGIGIVFSGLATAVGAVFAGIVSIVVAAFGMLGSVIAAIISPVGLVVLAIVAAGAAVYLLYQNIGNVFAGIARIAASVWNSLVTTFKQAFDILGSVVSGFGNFFINAFAAVGVAVDWLREQFGNLCSFTTESFGAIATALGRGDIEAAIGIVWASIKLIWTQGSNWLISTWYWVAETLQTAWATCVFKISELLIQAWHGVQEFWTETVYTMSTLWTEFSSGIISGWKKAEEAIAQGIGWIMAKMQGLDPNEMSAIINEDYNRQSREHEAAKSQALTDIQRNRDNKMASLKSEKDGTLGILRSDFEASGKTRNTAYQAKIAAQQKELDAAKAAYDEAINRARNPTPTLGGEESLVDKLKRKAEEAISGFKSSGGLGSKVSVTGSFSAAALKAMGGVSTMDRVAKATEEIAKNTRAPRNVPTGQSKDSNGKIAGDGAGKYKSGKDPALKEQQSQTRILRDIDKKIAVKFS